MIFRAFNPFAQKIFSFVYIKVHAHFPKSKSEKKISNKKPVVINRDDSPFFYLVTWSTIIDTATILMNSWKVHFELANWHNKSFAVTVIVKYVLRLPFNRPSRATMTAPLFQALFAKTPSRNCSSYQRLIPLLPLALLSAITAQLWLPFTIWKMIIQTSEKKHQIWKGFTS